MTNTELDNYQKEERTQQKDIIPFYQTEKIDFETVKEEYRVMSKLTSEFNKFKDEDVFDCDIKITGHTDYFDVFIICNYTANGFKEADSKCGHLETVISDIIFKITE